VKQTSPRTWKSRSWVLLACVLVAGALFLGGCGAPPPTPLTLDTRTTLANDMVRIENESVEKLRAERDTLAGEAADAADAVTVAHAYFLRGYVTETLTTKLEAAATPDEKITYLVAKQNYEKAIGSSYGVQALYRLGVLGLRDKLGTHEESLKVASTDLSKLRMQYEVDTGFFGGFTPGKPVNILARLSPGESIEKQNIVYAHPTLAGEGGTAIYVKPGEPGANTSAGPTIATLQAPVSATKMLDGIYQDRAVGWDYWFYWGVNGVFAFFRSFLPGAWAPIIGLIALALLVKLLTWPLTSASYKGMRDMQRIQPLIKDLQEKHKGDQAKLNEAQMALMKEHKVSPMGGCLPMLVQIPFFIALYHAVQVYAAHFDVPFLWVPSLSGPDSVLLLFYLVSMVATQWLTATPSADPQQKSMQSMMTIVMPIMLAAALKSVPSAFIFYWFALNVFSALHQYYLKHKLHEEEVHGTLEPFQPETPSKGQKRGKR
jgi:YidC/Oxa1 family membrane protein insertase